MPTLQKDAFPGLSYTHVAHPRIKGKLTLIQKNCPKMYKQRRLIPAAQTNQPTASSPSKNIFYFPYVDYCKINQNIITNICNLNSATIIWLLPIIAVAWFLCS